MRGPLGAIACALLLVIAGVTAAQPAQTETDPTRDVAAAALAAETAATGTFDLNGDWKHVLQVVANLRVSPPAEPVVVLLGGSAARECTVSDAVWASQIEAGGGPATRAFNLGSRNRSLAQNLAIVRALPRVRTIVFIGINLSSFSSPSKTATIKLPAPTASLPPSVQHLYGPNSVLSNAEKSSLVNDWLRVRHRVFQRNYGSCVGVLTRLVEVCKRRGFEPVLFELPRNAAVIGHRLDAPVSRYRRTCKALAKREHIPFVSFVARAELRSRDFADLWHVVEPGRSVWQRLLSARTVTLLTMSGHADRGG